MSMDVNNATVTEEVNDDVKAFKADIAMAEFANRLETGALTEKEKADIDSMMN